MRGRKPIPLALKLLRGNPGGRNSARHPHDSGPLPECPDWLHHYAKAEWVRVSPALSEMGLLTRVDAAALAAYCQCYAMWREACETVEREGLIATGSVGQKKVNPAADFADKMCKQLRAYCTEFGFTPSSRNRIEMPPGTDEGDELEDYVNGVGTETDDSVQEDPRAQ